MGFHELDPIDLAFLRKLDQEATQRYIEHVEKVLRSLFRDGDWRKGDTIPLRQPERYQRPE